MQDELQKFLDKQAVIDIGLRYASAVDQRDLTAFRGCFTEDAAWTSAVHEARGHRQIGEAVERAFANFDATQHVATNFEVEVGADSARMRSCFIATHVKAPFEPYVMGGIYEDDLVRTPEGWRIKLRHLTIQWTAGDAAMMDAVARIEPAPEA